MRGNPITTHEQLTSLIQNKKCVVIAHNPDQRLPACSLLNRQYRNTCDLLNNGMLFEYIPKPKEEPVGKSAQWTKIYSKSE